MRRSAFLSTNKADDAGYNPGAIEVSFHCGERDEVVVFLADLDI
jgi:hypothetical protein